nr:MAG TPA: hypothetical protein [Caudoviricetes sp.]
MGKFSFQYTPFLIGQNCFTLFYFIIASIGCKSKL